MVLQVEFIIYRWLDSYSFCHVEHWTCEKMCLICEDNYLFQHQHTQTQVSLCIQAVWKCSRTEARLAVMVRKFLVFWVSKGWDFSSFEDPNKSDEDCVAKQRQPYIGTSNPRQSFEVQEFFFVIATCHQLWCQWRKVLCSFLYTCTVGIHGWWHEISWS